MEEVSYNDKMTESPGESEMEGAVLAAILNQEQHLHTDLEEASHEDDPKSRDEAPGEVILGEGGSGWGAMTNPIIMDNISNFLSDKDLVALCLASKNTKKIVDHMDSIWSKRALKLEGVLRLDAATDSTSNKETRKTYKERYTFVKPKVEKLAKIIRAKMENDGRMSLEEQASAASLVHHGILVEVSCKRLCLGNVNLSSIPIQQLGSLASCVTDFVSIGGNVIISDLGVLLDKVKSNELNITSQALETGGNNLALVRAMQTRVKRVNLIHDEDEGTVDVGALTSYDGKGKCEEILVMVIESTENTGRITEEDMRQWAQAIGWDASLISSFRQCLIQRKH